MNVLAKPNTRVVMLGNEAIARGALEAGMGLMSSYPGTPSSEVPENIAAVAKQAGVYFEYATNEKIAFETAAGAAFSGVRAMTTMKQFGLNVAADSVGPVAYDGTKAGFVIMVADDPGGLSSGQSEQDSRYYARMFRLPVIEPANPQECLDYTKAAFELSEEFEIPVMLRTTTKVSHSLGTVKLGTIHPGKTRGSFKPDPARFANISPALQDQHRRIDEKLAAIAKKYSKKFTTHFPGKGNVGIISYSVGFDYAREALFELGAKPPVLKLGMTHPFPEEELKKFIRGKRSVIIVEELEPIIEECVARIAKDVNPRLRIIGKDVLPRYGEYSVELLLPLLGKALGKKSPNFAKHKAAVAKALQGMPPRKPVLCAGCPHRSTFYATKQVFGEDAVYAGDVGCYTLGVFKPFEMQAFLVSMGASLGIGHGVTRVSDQEVVAFVGDSTFFHACLPALANLKYNDARSPLVVVLDNSWTAMTGHQPNPTTGVTGMGDAVQPLNIEAIARALGAEVRVASAFSQKDLVEKLRELKGLKGPRVLISKGECRLVTKRKLAAKGQSFATFEINQKECKKCSVCTDKFACPAIMEKRDKAGGPATYLITPELCWGCSVCAQVCPHNAIHPKAVKA